MINNENYITIQGWMRNELNLKGNELLVYALIYGFSQDGESQFTGSARYIAEWIGSSRQTVANILKTLVDKGYIYKNDEILNGVKFCRYSAILHPVKKFDTPLSKNLTPPCQKSLHNNIDNNNIENNNIVEIVNYLNEKAGTHYRATTKATKSVIMARIGEKFTVDDFKVVIDKKVEQWKGTKMEEFLRPQTLFGTKFESYLNQNIVSEEEKKKPIEPPKYEFKEEKEFDPSRGEITGMPENMKRKYANYEKALGL